jgi:hypothetical protein
MSYHKYHKIENYLIFELVKKKMWANLQRIKVLLAKKFLLSSKKCGFGIRDPISESKKNLFRIPDLGVKKAPDPGSATLHMPTANIFKKIKTRPLYKFFEVHYEFSKLPCSRKLAALPYLLCPLYCLTRKNRGLEW